MRQRVSICVFARASLILLCLLLGSCHKAAPAAAPLSFPSGWPVAELTVPPGMQQAELFASLTYDSEDGMTVQGKPGVGDFDGTLWAVGFATKDNFANVVKAWEAELRNAGWYAVENDVESSDTRAQARQYVSPDRHMLIVVAHSEAKSKESGLTRGVLKLSVCSENVPLDQFLRRL